MGQHISVIALPTIRLFMATERPARRSSSLPTHNRRLHRRFHSYGNPPPPQAWALSGKSGSLRYTAMTPILRDSRGNAFSVASVGRRDHPTHSKFRSLLRWAQMVRLQLQQQAYGLLRPALGSPTIAVSGLLYSSVRVTSPTSEMVARYFTRWKRALTVGGTVQRLLWGVRHKEAGETIQEGSSPNSDGSGIDDDTPPADCTESE